MAQDLWTLQEKGKSQPAHGPPLQARVVAANRTVLATCATILAHMVMNKGRENAKQNGGKVDVGSKHGMANVNRQAKPAEQGRCRQTRPADNPAGTGLAAKQQPADEVGRPLAVQCRLVEGVRWCWPLGRQARTYLTVSLPPIAFAWLCPYPLP